ncbi:MULTISPECIES: hypothetical protein [Bacillus amyloliquefaciens group]|uniref:hypothetical protein n=1 Tax=Bacillus amyloliquefaciens group TaxID=1938374 RepID=UPI00073B52FB|nr:MULTISPECIES: hypothetical protein [Bacillus amyloliquefaciens group]KTF59729.1 hypothetical protein AR691_13430 [Bacillus amyloliquefaciens]
MAVLNGLEIRGVKKRVGHEGEDLPYGNVHYLGKCVGYFELLDWGAGFTYTHTSEVIDEDKIIMAATKVQELMGWHEKYKELEMVDVVLNELITFKDEEMEFKKAIKKGCYFVTTYEDMSLDPYDHRPSKLKRYYTVPVKLKNELSELVDGLNKEGFKVRVYKSEKDYVKC